ncbi:MAG: ion transporter [Alphaproteobacteria bacterium]|nr:ion transporter [Alphaproteobacteria bacterium]
MNIADIVQRSDTTPGRIFDWTIIGLIMISIVTLSIDTLPDLPQPLQSILAISEFVVMGLFTLEYCLRVATAPRKLGYIFSFYGVVDLLAIVPFYLSLGTIDAQVLRIVRLFRIIRILKLTRYSRAMNRFQKAVVLAKEEIVLFSGITAVLLYLAAFGIYHFEHTTQPEAFPSVLHSLWWATATLTTVGYGDVYPVTTGGRLFTFVILMCGLGIVAVPTGLVAAALSKVRQNEEREEIR